MEFDESKVYTALNADKLKVGSKVILAKNLHALEALVQGGNCICKLLEVREDIYQDRFYGKYASTGMNAFGTLAYLISEPEEKKLKWIDLKVGDIIRRKFYDGYRTAMVTVIDTCTDTTKHVGLTTTWLDDTEIEDWEKVEEDVKDNN